ncbi:MAG: hypothetical protein R6U57_01070 [Anaerolineales bacterium]
MEFFRPDQPRIPGTAVSYSRVAAGLMVIAGILVLLHLYEWIKLPVGERSSGSYRISGKSSRS